MQPGNRRSARGEGRSTVEAVKPILYLDVDGVICLWDEPACEVEEKQALDRMGPVVVPTGTKRRLEQLEAEFDVVWATAWRGRARTALAPVLEVGTEWEHLPYHNLKLPEIVKDAAGRDFAFVDDDADWELEQLGNIVPEGSLTLNTDPRVGLCDETVKTLLQYAAERKSTQGVAEE